MMPKNAKAHYANLARLPCVVTGTNQITLHHVHGGSIIEKLALLGLRTVKGFGQRGMSDALVIPLAAELHCLDKGDAIDGAIGVRAWEKKWGNQSKYVDDVSEALGYNLWELHALWTRQMWCAR